MSVARPSQANILAAANRAAVLSERVLAGQTSVVLNPQAAPDPMAQANADSGQQDVPDPARTVAVAKDSRGKVQLRQRDGGTREVSPDGSMSLGSGTAHESDELPRSLIVAVDSGNAVFIVDPDACASRKISPDGRVATMFLPPSRDDRPCTAAAGTR